MGCDNNHKKTSGFSGIETLDKGLLDAVSSVVASDDKIRMSDSDQYVDRVTANLPEDDSEMITESDYEPADSMGKYRGAHRMNLPKEKRYTAADEKRDREQHARNQADYKKHIEKHGETPGAAAARRESERMERFRKQLALKRKQQMAAKLAKKESFSGLSDEDINNLLEKFIHEGGLDNVNKKALKKNFKDRNDKDIDNDGDVDDSDEYLHNRRKKISSKTKEGKNGKKDPVVVNPTVGEKFDIKAFAKDLKEKALEWGTDASANKYKEMTPGQTTNTNSDLDEAGARDHFRKFQAKFKTMPKIDTKEYPDIRGLEGPFRFKNGAILYYDPKEGKYYDNKKDMYVDKLPEGWERE